MNALTLRAHFDGKHICLDEPCDLPLDTELLITVVPQSEAALQAEREEWARFSMQNLERAYGDDEPEYPRSMVKRLNPKYEGR